MAFLTVKTESVQKEGGSGYVTKSGIFDLTLRHTEVSNTTNGAVQVNYFFDKSMSYGNTILGVNGQPIFGYRILEALATVLGHEELSDPEPTTVQFKKGSKELNCIPELNDIQVKAWLQFSYRMSDKGIQENIAVKRFYHVDSNASGQELAAIAAGDDSIVIGTRYDKDVEFASEIKYEEGVTEDSVAAWKKASQSGGAAAPVKATANKSAGFPGKAKTGFPGGK